MTRRLKDIRHDLYAAASVAEAPIDDLISEYHAVVRHDTIYEVLDELQRELGMADSLPDAGVVAMYWAQTIVRGLAEETK